MNSPRLAIFPIVLTCFFLSGVAGLVYQIAWTRYLALILGQTSFAVIAVLVAFMGGLAIGAAWLGKFADRLERPLLACALIEVAIAFYAFLFPSLHGFVGSGGPFALRFILSAALILVPTILMGATLPMLARFATNSITELRGRVAALYSINSLGAVFGCWVADFWWIPTYGLEVAVYGGGLLNLIAGIVAFGLSRSILEGAPTAARLAQAQQESPEKYTPAEMKLALFAIGASGFVAMLYEIAWTRLLALALGSSTHAFSIMLMTFIAGIAAGAAILTPRRLQIRSLEALGRIEIALGATVFLSMFLYEPLPYWFARIGGLLARTDSAYPIYELAQALVCFAVMFLPATLLGMTLPLASRIAASELASTGGTVGRVFAVNTAGTVLGAAVTGLMLLPTLGLAGTFGLGFALNLAIGLAVLWRERLPSLNAPKLAAIPLACAAMVWIASALFTESWKGAFSQSVWRHRNAASLQQFRANGRTMQYPYHRDGAGSTVTIATRTNAHMVAMALKVNGKTDASTGDIVTQVLCAQVPAMMRPTATNALVVGLGSGMTAGSLMRHTNLLRADVVEISPEVVAAATHFSPFNDYVLENKRMRLTIDDAKSFLKSAGQKYDIIISQPSNPWVAGNASLFTQEYFAMCRDRLNPGGVIAQWVQVYEADDSVLRTVIKTFATAFPWISIWSAESGDLILIGETEQRAVDLDAFLKRARQPQIAEELTRIALNNAITLLARQIVSPANGAFIATAGDPIHSDYFPSLEYMSQRAFFVSEKASIHESVDETRSPRAETLLAELLRRSRLKDADFRHLAQLASEAQFTDTRLVYSMLHRWIEENPATHIPFEMLTRVNIERPIAIAEEARLLPRHAEILAAAESDPGLLHFYELTLMQAYRFKRSILYTPAAKELREVLNLLAERNTPQRRLFHLHRAELAWDRGDNAACLEIGTAALTPESNLGPVNFSADPQAPRIVLAALIQAHLKAGNASMAYATAQKAKLGGYTKEDSQNYAPLNLACRKAEAIFTEEQAASAKGR